MDRRPPTLIKSLPLAKFLLASDIRPESAWTSEARLLHTPNSSTLRVVIGPAIITPGLTSLRISLIDVVSSRSTGLISQCRTTGKDEITRVQMSDPIDHFVRTPNGRALMAVGQSGEIGIWSISKVGNEPKAERAPGALDGKGQWTELRPTSRFALFAKGRAIVRCIEDDDEGASITLSHLDENAPSPTGSTILPGFVLGKGDKVKLLFAVSDIDDGYSSRSRKTQRAIILAASQSGDTWVWRVISPMISTTSASFLNIDRQPEMTLLSQYRLPVELARPYLIVQVDPMGWHQSVIDWQTDTPLQDMILTVSKEGVLEFWTPQLGHHFTFDKDYDRLADGPNGFGEVGQLRYTPWTRSSVVRTGRSDPLMVRCSSRRKTVLGEPSSLLGIGIDNRQSARSRTQVTR